MARGHPQIPFVSSEVETPRRRARLTGISTSLDANEKKTKASGRPPAEPFFQRNHLPGRADRLRSEEHTSELQSLMRNSYAVFCLKTKTLTQRNRNKLATFNINKHR